MTKEINELYKITLGVMKRIDFYPTLIEKKKIMDYCIDINKSNGGWSDPSWLFFFHEYDINQAWKVYPLDKLTEILRRKQEEMHMPYFTPPKSPDLQHNLQPLKGFH